MRRLATLSILMALTACAKKESPPAGAGSAPPPPAEPTPPAPPTGSAATGSDAPAPAPSGDPEAEVADLVVKSVGSKALGSQTIEASCVWVATVPVGDWTVAAARLEDCGDKNARSIIWLYKRGQGGKWNEDYAGTPPKCWKGVPPDIAEAVTKLTKIPRC
jgi:hypothetical protein